MEWKISVIRSRSPTGRSSRRGGRPSDRTAFTGPSVPLVRHALQPLGRERGGAGVREILHHAVEGLARALPLLLLILAVADLERGVGDLGGGRIVLDHLLEGGQ